MCEKTATHFAKIEKVIPSENITCQTGNKCYQMPGNQVSRNLEKLYNGLQQMPNRSGILWGVNNFQVENTVILLPFFHLSKSFFFLLSVIIPERITVAGMQRASLQFAMNYKKKSSRVCVSIFCTDPLAN